jgi:hypothetical protein
VSLQTVIYCSVCSILQETSFQIILLPVASFLSVVKNRASSLVSVVGACVGLPSALTISNSVIKQYLYRDLHKNDIVRGLVYRDNNIIVMEVRHVPSNIRVYKDRCCASAQWSILICINNHTVLVRSEIVSTLLSGIILIRIHRKFKFGSHLWNIPGYTFHYPTQKVFTARGCVIYTEVTLKVFTARGCVIYTEVTWLSAFVYITDNCTLFTVVSRTLKLNFLNFQFLLQFRLRL